MSTMAAETCANCGTAIGKLETVHVFRDHVVCSPCLAKLQLPPQPLGYATPIPNAPPPPVPAPAQVFVQLPLRPKWSGGIAAVLSLFIPGAGQIYKGQTFNGLAWLVFVVVGYALFVIPGLVLHLCCILGAASGDPYK